MEPQRKAELNGAPVTSACRSPVKQFDDIFRIDQDQEDYEKGLCNARKCVFEKGDSYTIIGGGLGITAIKASETADHITVYEASSKKAKIIGKNCELNEVRNVDVRNAIVGQIEYQPKGKFREIPSIEPSEIPKTDSIELDCEGAERYILDNLKFEPKGLIVEFHPFDEPECGVGLFKELKSRYDSTYCFGHDGIKITEKTARALLRDSRDNPKTFSDGARSPIVTAFKK